MPIDIHTHHTTIDTPAIISLSANEYTPNIRACSIGIHPWHITADWQRQMEKIRSIASSENVLMIGECGLDKVKSSASMQEQEVVFRQHIDLSEQVGKPLIIHSVKAFDRLMAIRKEAAPRQTWILHGFRGKPLQAHQILSHGIELSFGLHFNPESLLQAYTARAAWFETDDSNTSIAEVYSLAALSLGTTAQSLSLYIEEKVRATESFRQLVP